MDKQDKIIELLSEILKFTKPTSMFTVKKLLEETLSNDKKKIAYHFSNGEKTAREVASLAGVDFRVVCNWWKTWYGEGIADSIGAKRGRRAKVIFSLKDLGIKVPRVKPRG